MSRRFIYLLGIALFVPAILIYAGRFSDLPEGSFSDVHLMADSVEKALVPGVVIDPEKVAEQDGALTFYLQDDAGTIERVVYDGAKPVDVPELKQTIASKGIVKVAGHFCTDGQGERFHAKNVYLP